jgi:hypothetical protein
MRRHGGNLVNMLAAGGVIVLAAFALTACTSSVAPTKPTTTVTETAPSPSASAPPSDAPSTGPATPVASQRPGGECLTSSLTGSLTALSGAAGTTYTNIVLTNHSSVPCTIQGWPGVSFVGRGNGTQIGASAVLDRTSAHATQTVAPGRAVYALLAISGYNADQCDPKTADGLRIYPPGQRTSLFVAHSYSEACTGVDPLRVGAFGPAAQP